MDAKPLVFVVDDDPIQLGVLEQAFASLHVPWDTRFFQDPSDVILQLRKHPGALVVTDWMMPEMSGLDLCRQVRDDTWHGKGFHYCILLTSRRSARDAAQGLDEAHEYLVKPVDPERLAARIEAGLRYSQPPVPAPSLPSAPSQRSALHCRQGAQALFEVPLIERDTVAEFGQPEPDGPQARFRPSQWAVTQCDNQGLIEVPPAHAGPAPKGARADVWAHAASPG